MRQSHRYPNRCHLEVHAAVCLGMGVGVRHSTRSPMSPSPPMFLGNLAHFKVTRDDPHESPVTMAHIP